METVDKMKQDWLTNLYLTTFPAVAQHISRQGGSLDEAKDIFQDALIIYYEKAVAGKLQLTHSEKAYILGIAKHLWYQQQHKQKGKVNEDVLNYTELPEDVSAMPSTKRLLRYLETAGQKCMDMLQAFYYDKLPMKDIAERFGLSGERSATVQKHKCLEKVRETVKAKSLTYEDFCN
ncbi:sigma-70 family RNA polymerase sigma factor [Mucilaginibacter sp. PAMB04168]|uniref:RNA polymerase sigma factor n=1 Tax=Mucilaginibacter sp. PAMB04168 TaxID=3138567 RepID=UPI0031F68C6D